MTPFCARDRYRLAETRRSGTRRGGSGSYTIAPVGDGGRLEPGRRDGGAPRPQAEPQYLAVPFEIARTLPERLLGYFVHEPNLGSLEGQDPIRLLTGELTINGHFSEFLPEEVKPLLAEHRARLKAA